MKILKITLGIVVGLLVSLSKVEMASASMFVFYQPELPEE